MLVGKPQYPCLKRLRKLKVADNHAYSAYFLEPLTCTIGHCETKCLKGFIAHEEEVSSHKSATHLSAILAKHVY